MSTPPRLDRLTHRFDQILALARSDAGANPVRVDLHEVVRQRIAVGRVQADAAGVKIAAALPDFQVLVLAGEGAVARVVDELLGNAFIYAAADVSASVTEPGGYAQLVVADDGPGVSDPDLASVFERFYRGSNAKPGGTGLGLALVRETTTAVGGSARAESNENGGLTITTTWPLVP